MSVSLRILLIVFSILTFLYLGRKIRKSQMQLKDALFWVFLSLVMVIISAVPQIAFFASDLLGFQAPVNFIFLVIIFILLIKTFLLSIKISQLDNQIKEFVQKYAIDKNNSEKNEKQHFI